MAEQTIHQIQGVISSGADLDDAHLAVILLHGRGSTAASMLGLAAQFPQENIAYLAPQAANYTWYPNSGFIPIEANEPYVTSAFQLVSDLVARVNAAGIASDRLILGGFSQGACLAAEFVARHPRRYGGVLVLSGALMGPLDAPREYPGSLDNTPVYIAGSNRDPWVTEPQMILTGQVLQQLGGVVHTDIQPDNDHTVRQSEVDHVTRMISDLLR